MVESFERRQKDKKYIIVGGTHGGVSAAVRLRRLDERAKITLFEKGQSVIFDGCGLPYYLGGTVKEIDELKMQTPGNIKKKYNIDVKVNMEITGINRREKKVEVKNLATGRKYHQSYDKLVLADCAACNPNIKDIDSEKVFRLSSIADFISIKENIEKNNVKRVVVAGGNYKSLVIAENIAKRGITVSVVEPSDHVMPEFDYDMSQLAAIKLEESGLMLITETDVEAFEDTEEGISIELSNGSILSADILIMDSDVEPEVALARKAGLGIGVTGGILVDERQQTTDKDIYAIGDSVEAECLCGGKMLLPLTSAADRQGRVAADNMCGIGSRYKKTLGVTILKLFDSVFACAGLTEKTLSERKEDYVKIYTRSWSRAMYCPEASEMTIKMMFENKTGRILGVQIAGQDGVDKRIDVFAAAMRAGLSADRLSELEFAYAPPFGTPKDAVNIAGSIASDIIGGLMDVVYWHDIDGQKGSMLIDVRPKTEHEAGTIKSAVNIPLLELRERISSLPKDKEMILFCSNGRDAYTAERMLKQRGYIAKHLSGGYSLYKIFNRIKAEK